MFFTMRTGVLPGELPSRGRSIQAGSLCYNNGFAVEMVGRLDASLAPRSGGAGVCTISQTVVPGEVGAISPGLKTHKRKINARPRRANNFCPGGTTRP